MRLVDRFQRSGYPEIESWGLVWVYLRVVPSHPIFSSCIPISSIFTPALHTLPRRAGLRKRTALSLLALPDNNPLRLQPPLPPSWTPKSNQDKEQAVSLPREHMLVSWEGHWVSWSLPSQQLVSFSLVTIKVSCLVSSQPRLSTHTFRKLSTTLFTRVLWLLSTRLDVCLGPSSSFHTVTD